MRTLCACRSHQAGNDDTFVFEKRVLVRLNWAPNYAVAEFDRRENEIGL